MSLLAIIPGNKLTL